MQMDKAASLKHGSKVRVPRLWGREEFAVAEVIYRCNGDVRTYEGGVNISSREHYEAGIHVNGELLFVDCRYVKKA